MNILNRERREWALLIIIVPIGVFMMMIAGQIAVRIIPVWAVNANMESSLDPETTSGRPVLSIQPLSPDILDTPPWYYTFLLPSSNLTDDINYPSFLVLEATETSQASLPPSPEPSSTPPPASSTEPSTPEATGTPPPTADTPEPPPTKPPKDDDSPPVVTATTPVTVTVTTTTTSTATSTATSTPTTISPSLTPTTPAVAISTGAPDGITITNLNSGNYTVVTLGGSGVKVESTPDGNYDLVFYEAYSVTVLPTPWSGIQLDKISLGISNDPSGSTYWEVFNWGNNSDGLHADTNTNVDVNVLNASGASAPVDASEADNQKIDESDLHPGPTIGPVTFNTGILIDVDTASSSPPPGDYQYIVVISPSDGGDAAQIDAIVVSEVPIPP